MLTPHVQDIKQHNTFVGFRAGQREPDRQPTQRCTAGAAAFSRSSGMWRNQRTPLVNPHNACLTARVSSSASLIRGAIPTQGSAGLAGNSVARLHGQARFTGAARIEIDCTSYDADRFLLAAGARPCPLEFPGHEYLIDSTDFLDLDVLPPRILFVGGGVVSFEFAHLAARAGSSPVIVDRGERPLKSFDPDLVERLIGRSNEVGIALRRSTTIAAVEQGDRGYRVTLERSGVRETIQTDLLVHGAARSSGRRSTSTSSAHGCGRCT